MQIKIFNSRKLNDTQEFNLELATSNLKGECFIGRSPASSLILDSADVSRLHGKFFQQSGNYYFIDVGSRNGSIINGKLAEINQRYLIKPGDVLRIGEFVLILEEMDVIRQDLADTVFGSTDATVISLDQFGDNLPSAAIASPDEIFISTAEVVETSIQVTATAENIKEISATISINDTFIQIDDSKIASEEATFIQIPQLAADTTFNQPSATDLNINSNKETVLFTTQQSAEIEVFTSPDSLTEAEKTVIGNLPTHIETFNEIPQFSITNSEAQDQLPISHKREFDPILELDPWQDLESEAEIALALTQNAVVVEEKATATKTVPTVAPEKYMALMAHDRQKNELAQFAAQHQAFFSQHLTIATPTTSVTLQQAGLEVTAETPALPIGGYQAIANLVNSGNVLAVILLKDVLELSPSEQENEAALIRACNLNQVLLATNLATAEAIVHFLTLGAT